MAAAAVPAYEFGVWAVDELEQPWSYVAFMAEPTAAELAENPDRALLQAQLAGLAAMLVLPLWLLAFTALAVLSKWVVMGRQREGAWRLRSAYHLRWWYVDRLLSVWEFFAGRFLHDTVLAVLVYRLLGARVAWSASVGTLLREPDLVEVGAGATVDGRVFPRLLRADRLRFARVAIGAGATLSGGSVLLPGARLEAGAATLPNTVVAEGSSVPAAPRGRSWAGNPCWLVAQPDAPPQELALVHEFSSADSLDTNVDDTSGGSSFALVGDDGASTATSGGGSDRSLGSFDGDNDADEACARMEAGVSTGARRGCSPIRILEEAAKIVAMFGVLLLLNACGVPVRLAWRAAGVPRDFRYTALAFYASLYFGTLTVFAAATVALKWAVFGRVRAGEYVDSAWLRFWRHTMGLMQSVLFSWVLLFDYSRVNWLWVRALGGPSAPAGSVLLNPLVLKPQDADLLELDSSGAPVFMSNCHVAPDSWTEAGDGTRVRRKVRVGPGSWVGLHAVLGVGVGVGAGGGVGVGAYVPGGTHVAPGAVAFGNPPVQGGQPPSSSGTGGVSVREASSGRRRRGGVGSGIFSYAFGVLLWAVQSGVECGAAVAAYEAWVALERLDLHIYAQIVAGGVAAALAFTVSLLVAAFLLKWALVGRARSGTHAADGSGGGTFFTRYLAAERAFYHARVYALPFWSGTAGAVAAHRLMGARVAWDATVHATTVLDHELVEVGAGAVLDEGAGVLGHVFSGATFARGRTFVGAGAVVQPHAVLFSGDRVEAGATLAAFSKLHPGQAAAAAGKGGAVWRGNPAERCKA